MDTAEDGLKYAVGVRRSGESYKRLGVFHTRELAEQFVDSDRAARGSKAASEWTVAGEAGWIRRTDCGDYTMQKERGLRELNL